METPKPLVLDVDGTFLRTDMLFECFWAALGKNPGATLSTCLRNMTRAAVLKQDLAQLAELRTDLLPVHSALKQHCGQERAAEREIILASGSDQSLVVRLAAEHGFSKTVFASDGVVNLKGSRKADKLVARFGENGFDYAGNERADLAIWQRAEHALIVGDLPSIRRNLTAKGKTVTDFRGGWAARDLLRALRPHQWVKNVLLLLPMLAAHDFSLTTLSLVVVGMVAFSGASSSIYNERFVGP